MKIIKTETGKDWGNGCGGHGASYAVEGTNITIIPAAGRWQVWQADCVMGRWDSFQWAKEHALEIAYSQ